MHTGNILSFDNVIQIAAFVFGIVSLILMIIIAGKQNKDTHINSEVLTDTRKILKDTNIILNDSQTITKDTNTIARKLETDSFLKSSSKIIFKISDDKKLVKYNLIYPAVYRKKPMPDIHQGDFYAIHVLASALEMVNINMKDVRANRKDCKILSPDSCPPCKERAIFICAPQANPCLDAQYPYAVKIQKKDRELAVYAGLEECADMFCVNGHNRRLCTNSNDIITWLHDLKLPCWFLSEIQFNNGSLKERRKIQLAPKNPDLNLPLSIASPADELYDLAEESEDETIPTDTVTDLGIFARIHDDYGSAHIVLSGIHQYGTWIVADFVNNLLRKGDNVPNEKNREILMGASDFICVIKGDFMSRSLHVDQSYIDGGYLWTRIGKEIWKRCDEE